ncbi:MAG: MFS transporter [FCB group bacterium]|jgi:MFS family permease|nr:MFS transporter [FCB group bacterium]
MTTSHAPSRGPHHLPKVVLTLGWISLLTDIASEMVYPVIPLFLSAARSAGGLGAPVAALGLIEGVAEAVVSVMKGLSGWHSDRLRRRVPYIQWGYGLGNAAKGLLAFAWGWPMVFAARTVDRVGKGLRTTARDALIADAIDAGQAGRAYGFHRAMDTTGAFIGVLLAAALLFLLPGQYRLIFGLALVPGVLAILLTMRLREASPGVKTEAAAPTVRAARRFSPTFWKALFALTLFALANSSDTFLLLRARSLGMSDGAVVLTYALYNLSYALLSYPAGILSDRLGRWRVMALGWLVYAAVYAGFALIERKEFLWPLFLIYGVYMGLTQGVGRALVADFAPADARGTALGLFNFAGGMAALLSSLLAGLLWDWYGPATTFAFGSVTALAAVLLLPFLIRAQKTQD